MGRMWGWSAFSDGRLRRWNAGWQRVVGAILSSRWVTLKRKFYHLQKTYEFFTKQAGFNEDLTVTEQGIQQILSFLGSTVLPGAKNASPKQIYDTRILEKIRQWPHTQRVSLQCIALVSVGTGISKFDSARTRPTPLFYACR